MVLRADGIQPLDVATAATCLLGTTGEVMGVGGGENLIPWEAGDLKIPDYSGRGHEKNIAGPVLQAQSLGSPGHAPPPQRGVFGWGRYGT